MEEEDQKIINFTISSQEANLKTAEDSYSESQDYQNKKEKKLNKGKWKNCITTFKNNYLVYEKGYDTPKYKIVMWFFAFVSHLNLDYNMGSFWSTFNWDQKKQISDRNMKKLAKGEAIEEIEESRYVTGGNKDASVANCKFRPVLPDSTDPATKSHIATFRGDKFHITVEDLYSSWKSFEVEATKWFDLCSAEAKKLFNSDVSNRNRKDKALTEGYFDERISQLESKLGANLWNEAKFESIKRENASLKLQNKQNLKKLSDFLGLYNDTHGPWVKELAKIVKEWQPADDSSTESLSPCSDQNLNPIFNQNLNTNFNQNLNQNFNNLNTNSDFSFDQNLNANFNQNSTISPSLLGSPLSNSLY